ncbi:MAG: hypothetical protein ACOH2N_14200 [Devosia sp.]
MGARLKGVLIQARRQTKIAVALISVKLCSGVQRRTTSLREKGIAIALVYVNLAEWFITLSPLGKMPLLKAGGMTPPPGRLKTISSSNIWTISA